MPIDPPPIRRKRRKSKQRRDLKTGLQLGASLLGLIWVAQTAVAGFEYYKGTRHSFLWLEHSPAGVGSAPSAQRLEQAQSVLMQLGRHESWPVTAASDQIAEATFSPSDWLTQSRGSETAVPIARAGLPIEFLSAQFAPAGQPLPDNSCETAACFDLSALSNIETVSTHAVSPQEQSAPLFAADQDLRQARELCYRYLSSDAFRSSFKLASPEPVKTGFWGRHSGDSTWAICNNIQRYVSDVRRLNDKLAALEQLLDQHQAGLQSSHVFAPRAPGSRFAPEIYLQQVIAELAQAEADAQVFYLHGATAKKDWARDWNSSFEHLDHAP